MVKITLNPARLIRYGCAAAALIALLVFTYFFNKSGQINQNGSGGASNLKYEKAYVVGVVKQSVKKDATSGLYAGSQEIRIRILSGKHAGEVQNIQNYLSNLNNIYAKQGQTLIVRILTQNKNSYTISVFGYYRAPIVYGFVLLFFAAMWAVGGKKGLKSVFGLLFSFFVIIFLYIPMIYRGYQPVLSSFIISVAITLVALLLIDGFTPKSLSAISGTIIGTGIAALISVLAGLITHITGYNTGEAETLSEIAHGTHMQIGGILFGSVLISSLGGVMDIAMSISSSISEVHSSTPGLTHQSLFKSGMNIGRDMMGTMANTLILSFVGTSFATLLLIYSYNVPYNQLINTDLVAVEVIQGLSGSAAVVLTVPIISLIASRVIPAMAGIGKNTKGQAVKPGTHKKHALHKS